MMTAKPGLHCQVRSINSQTEVIAILVAYLVLVSFYRGCIDSVCRRVSVKEESSKSETRYSPR